MTSLRSFLIAAASVLGLFVVALSACPPPTQTFECTVDADCGAGRVCAGGACQICAGNDDCAAGQFCCRGECFADTEVQHRCGCGPAAGANPGQDCSTVEPAGVCLVGDSTASAANVASGTCGCGCTAAQGGPFCGPPATPGDPPQCTCSDNVDCRKPSVSSDGRPHLATDTCTPDAKCVCFSLGTAEACDPDGATPDCTGSGGCSSVLSDAANCGVQGRSCTDEATGVPDGICVGGGCECNDAGDCVGTSLNVNTCAFPVAGEGSRCVCNGYTRDGVGAACPMELPCVAGGCQLEGAVFATEEAMRAALGLP